MKFYCPACREELTENEERGSFTCEKCDFNYGYQYMFMNKGMFIRDLGREPLP